TASDTTINGGASVVLSGSLTGTAVVSGTLVLSHGSASGTIVGAGGEQIISGFGALYDLGSSARAGSATILSGGLQVVDGVASAAMLAGGEMIVSSGGVTEGAVVGSGGTLVVLSGRIDGGDPALNIGASIVQISIPTTVESGGTEFLMG